MQEITLCVTLATQSEWHRHNVSHLMLGFEIFHDFLFHFVSCQNCVLFPNSVCLGGL